MGKKGKIETKVIGGNRFLCHPLEGERKERWGGVHHQSGKKKKKKTNSAVIILSRGKRTLVGTCSQGSSELHKRWGGGAIGYSLSRKMRLSLKKAEHAANKIVLTSGEKRKNRENEATCLNR